MALEHYRGIRTIECEHCKAKQTVHTAGNFGAGQYGPQNLRCVACQKSFEVMLPEKIVGGPFPP